MNKTEGKTKYDLEERTACFGEAIINFAKKISKDTVNMPLINQLVKSGTSIGANYAEADDAESRADFKHKIGICKKEARETKYWLRMIPVTAPALREASRPLLQESQELVLIFNAIIKSTRINEERK